VISSSRASSFVGGISGAPNATFFVALAGIGCCTGIASAVVVVAAVPIASLIWRLRLRLRMRQAGSAS
jgi:hypothetical protein